LVAATNKIKGGVWFMFGLITFIQMIGNIFFSYKEIDATGDLFKSWMELTGPVWEMLGSKANDVIAMKRWLAFLEGGLLPIISLTSLHFFTKYDDGKSGKEEVKEVIKEVIVEKEVIKEVIVEVPVIEEVIVEKIIRVPIEIEKIVEVPVFQSESITDEEYADEGNEYIDLQDKYVSPGMDTNEPPRPNRLSYVKPNSTN